MFQHGQWNLQYRAKQNDDLRHSKERAYHSRSLHYFIKNKATPSEYFEYFNNFEHSNGCLLYLWNEAHFILYFSLISKQKCQS